MRHYMVDPDNEERLLKIPQRVVSEIRAEALEDAIQQVEVLPVMFIGDYVGITEAQVLDALRDLIEQKDVAIRENWEKFSRDQFDAGYSDGQSDAIATAVQQLKDYLQHDVADGWMPRQKAEGIIATITGEHP
jgi:hypothetical protein